MRNFYHTCKSSALIINFSEVWPRQILDLGKEFNLMICLERCLEDVLKTFLQDVLKTSWQDVLKMSGRRLEDVLKTSWRRLLKTYEYGNYIRLDQDVLRTSWWRLLKTKTNCIFKTSSSRRMFPRCLQKY